MWNDIVQEATRNVPDSLWENEDFVQVVRYLDGWLDEMSSWVDVNSDAYREELWEVRRDGALSVVERYQSLLAEALYRQDLFGEEFDLRAFIDRLSSFSLDEVLEEV